jgi:hypothetical protein
VNFTYEALRDRSQTPGAVNTTPSDPNPATGFPYFVFPNLGLPGYTGNDPFNHAGTDNRAGYLVDLPRGHAVQANGYHLNTDWTIGAGTFTWVQGYREQDSLPSNYTGVVGPISVFDASRSDNRKTWQEELRCLQHRRPLQLRRRPVLPTRRHRVLRLADVGSTTCSACPPLLAGYNNNNPGAVQPADREVRCRLR